MDEPTPHVAITKDDDVEFDFFDWQGDSCFGKDGNFEFCYDNKAHIWANGSLFATPLTAIENRKDIENPLVNPAVALIQEDWNGTKESCGGLEQLIQFKKIFP